MRYTLYNIIALLAGMALVMTSCEGVGVDICEKTEHGAELNVRYHWPASARKTPDKTWIVSRRPADFLRGLYGWFPNDIDSQEYTDMGYEVGQYNKDSTTWEEEKMHWFEEEATIESEEIKTQLMRRGSYWFMSMNCSRWLMYEPLVEFMNDENVKLSETRVMYDPVPSPEELGERWQDWIDTNHKYPYAEDLGDIYICKKEVDVNNDEPIFVDFEPEALSQRLDFKFNIESDHQNLLVDSVRCELSGVCYSKLVTSGYLDMDGDKSIRVLFALEDKDIVQSGTTYDCTGIVAVLGLCFPQGATMQTGPGILRISAYTHYTTAEGTRKSRTYLWSINLWAVLKDHPVTIRTSDGLQYVNSSDHEVIELPHLLEIKVADYGNPDEGTEKWPDDGYVDIEF